MRSSSFVRTVFLAAVAASALLEASTAPADAELRDHRAAPAAVDNGIHYRRRPGPRFMMPLKVDIGAVGMNTSRGFAPGVGMAVGIHWASLSPEPTNTDVGVGVFGAIAAAPADPNATGTMADSKNGVLYGGLYLEAGHTLAHGDWWRTWATGRGEYLGSAAFGDSHAGFGATGRLSAELYVHGVGIEPRGVFLGTYAIGVYAEAGVRNVRPPPTWMS